MLSYEDFRLTCGNTRLSDKCYTPIALARASNYFQQSRSTASAEMAETMTLKYSNSCLQPETPMVPGLRIRLSLPCVRSAVFQTPGLQDATAENLNTPRIQDFFPDCSAKLGSKLESRCLSPPFMIYRSQEHHDWVPSTVL